jgi:2-polyprenyl-6-methoxyphenol hydroxylase-like FAD-dependent oxidoreductase
MAHERCDVLVVGAGPIGLALSCHLRRLGLAVRVVEKRSGPSEHSKAIGLQYRVSEVLARLGIVDRFIALGGSPTTVNLYAGHEQLVQLRFVAPRNASGRDAFEPRAILIPQSQTEALLIAYLEELGGSIEWRTDFLAYDRGPAGVVSRVQRHDSSCEEIQFIAGDAAHIHSPTGGQCSYPALRVRSSGRVCGC